MYRCPTSDLFPQLTGLDIFIIMMLPVLADTRLENKTSAVVVPPGNDGEPSSPPTLPTAHMVITTAGCGQAIRAAMSIRRSGEFWVLCGPVIKINEVCGGVFYFKSRLPLYNWGKLIFHWVIWACRYNERRDGSCPWCWRGTSCFIGNRMSYSELKN